MSVPIRGVLAALLAVLALGALAPGASAHERRTLGRYVVVVGFLHEPTFVEELNGVSVTAFTADGQPVEGVEKTLKVEVSTGTSSRTFDLAVEPGKRGAYKAEFIPTKTGPYVFRFFGKLSDQEVNERFESGPNRFDEVTSKAALQFPSTVPSNGELAAGLTAAPRGQATAVPSPATEPRGGSDRSSLALAVGVLGLVAGIVGAALGFAGLSAARRAATPGGAPPRTGRSEPI
ncbi:MAG: hypothetical protein U0531_09275 [Dehalococcoidia bacterium]